MYLVRSNVAKGQRGPYKKEEIFSMVRAGDVKQETLLSDDGGKHFWPARDMLPPGAFPESYSESAPGEHRKSALEEEPQNEQAVCEVPLTQESEDTAEPAEPDTKQCPYCGETILRVAIICKHCRSSLAAGAPFIRANDRNERIASGISLLMDFKGVCNIVAGLCGLLLVVSVFLPSVDTGALKRMFISQDPVDGVIVLFDGLIVLAIAIANVFLRKRLEIVYFCAALGAGIISALVLNELKSRGENLASALNALGTKTQWYDVIGPAMYIMMACAGILFLTWLVSGIVHWVSKEPT